MASENFFKFRGHAPLYSISVSSIFLRTSLPPTPNCEKSFDLYVTVLFVMYVCISNYTACSPSPTKGGDGFDVYVCTLKYKERNYI